jgi:futalosine hydrolase
MRALDHRHAAVHMQGLARDIGGFVGGQIDGSGGDFVSAEALGWHQWHGDQSNAPIGDLNACGPGGGTGGSRSDLLLSVCAAAASAEDVRHRKQAFPAAMAEDMEGFAVAFACRLRGVPVDVVRGISNVAGDRDKSRWQVAAAVESAGRLALQIMAEAS